MISVEIDFFYFTIGFILTLIDYSEMNHTDQMWYVKPLLTSFSNSFPRHRALSRVIIVDESLVGLLERQIKK